jgi:PAS domain S-box-containing protein
MYMSEANMVLSKVIDGCRVPLFVINQQHVVTHWNTAIEALTRTKRDSIIGTDDQWTAFYVHKRPTLADLVVDGDTDDLADVFYQVGCTRSTSIRDAYEVQDFFPILGEKGRWLHISACPIRNDEGIITGAVETVEDITERTAARFALHQSEKSYQDLFENAVDAIWVQDMEGNALLVNKACERLTGFTREELLARNVKELLVGEWLELAREVRRKLLAGEKISQPYEQHLVRKDGMMGTLTMSTTLINVDGKPAGFQHMARDMTDEISMRESIRFYLQQVLVAQEEERKRIARELHDDTAQLLVSISRQLDNFVRRKSVLAPDDMLYLKDMQEKINKGVAEVHRFSQALRSSVLDDLGLLPAIRSLLKGLQDAEGTKTELIVKGEERRYSPEIETMLFRIVQEAVNNIRKHAKSPDARVSIDFGDDKVVITIADNGQGFDPDRSQADFLRNGKLGLSGIRERARLLGGSVIVTPVLGKGTTLTVTVPSTITGSWRNLPESGHV